MGRKIFQNDKMRLKQMMFAAAVGLTAALAIPVAYAGIGNTRTAVEGDTGSGVTEEITWLEVTSETPGGLGYEVLSQVDVLGDVTNLRVTGSLNADDWLTIKNMTKIVNLDLSKCEATGMPDEEFMGRTSLKTILLPANLPSIGNNAFYQSGITAISIPASVKTIGEYCFYKCSSLTQVAFDVNGDLNSIGVHCFSNCGALSQVTTMPSKLYSIPGYAFYQCESLASIDLPTSLTQINNRVFYECTSLKEILLPESLSYIGEYAFYYAGLTYVEIPVGVNTIGNEAFRDCQSLEEVVLPGKTYGYSDYQFTNCNKLKKVTCPMLVPPSGSSITVNTGATLCVPDCAVVSYKLSSFWKNFSNIEGGANVDSYSVKGKVDFNNNRRPEGTPDIVLLNQGTMSVDGTAALNLDYLQLSNFATSSNAWEYGQLINNSPAMTANQVQTRILPRPSNSSSSSFWKFICFPHDVKVGDIQNYGTDFVVRYYDGAQRAASGTGKSWKNMENDSILKAGHGYIFQASDMNKYFGFNSCDNTALFNPNAHVIALEENASENAANAGWNFIGNPYPSYYDMYYAMLTCPVTIWDEYNKKYVAYSLIDDNLVLKPNQPFFIQASAELTEVNFDTPGRQFTASVSNRPAKTRAMEAGSKRSLFNLSVSMSGDGDRTRVVLNEDAAADYEAGRDAAKFFGENGIQLYSLDNAMNTLSINEVPASVNQVRLGLCLPEAGEFTINADRIDGTAVLHDKLTGKSYNLQDGASYKFDSKIAGNINDRFYMTMEYGKISGISHTEDASLSVSAANGIISVSGMNGTDVAVYSMEGRKVASASIESGKADIELPAGIYVVRACGRSAKVILSK